MTPHRIGITGGIGSGKSSVSRLLASYCLIPLVDIDQCCRQLLEINQPGWQALRDRFGEAFLQADGRIDRSALRGNLFADKLFRQEVDGLLHPLARAALHREVTSRQAELMLIEIPLLYEAGWRQEVDEVLVVYARRGVRCCRIMQRDGVTRQQASRAIAAQMPLAEKAARAELVIDNSGSWSMTRDFTVALGKTLSERFPRSSGQEKA